MSKRKKSLYSNWNTGICHFSMSEMISWNVIVSRFSRMANEHRMYIECDINCQKEKACYVVFAISQARQDECSKLNTFEFNLGSFPGFTSEETSFQKMRSTL